METFTPASILCVHRWWEIRKQGPQIPSKWILTTCFYCCKSQNSDLNHCSLMTVFCPVCSLLPSLLVDSASLLLPESSLATLPPNILYIYKIHILYMYIYIYIVSHTFLFFVHLLSPVWIFCSPMDHTLSGSSVPGISQAGILEWDAISFSRGSSQPRDQTCISYIDRQILCH